MLTWETLVEKLESGDLNDNHRLICQLLLMIYLLGELDIQVEDLFNNQRKIALETCVESYRERLIK